MKKYYYITVVAIMSIAYLQADYVYNLYNNYIEEKIISLEDTLRIALDKELYLRTRSEARKATQGRQKMIIKQVSDMTPEEIDSLKRTFSGGDTIDITRARKRGVGDTSADIYQQIKQDHALQKGKPLNLRSLDSLLRDMSKDHYPHCLLVYDKNKALADSVGNLGGKTVNYQSVLYPIGTKGLQYLQIKAAIPMSHFLRQQWWTLGLSVGFMTIVWLCLFYQLTEIRRKDEWLRKREATVNGTIHDLKAPLNSVVTMLSWFKMTETDAQKKETLDICRAGVRHLVYTIESLLLTARKDRRKIVLHKTPVDLAALTDTVKKELDLLYQEKPHTIEVENKLPVGLAVKVDGMYMENVIRNLVENALKYSDEGVMVKVTFAVENKKLHVWVKDNGWGIDPRFRKKLFKQFYQVPRRKEQMQKGYGIGLAQAKCIIQAHDGEIRLLNTEGRGCVFTFTLPLS